MVPAAVIAALPTWEIDPVMLALSLSLIALSLFLRVKRLRAARRENR